ncbi:oxygenase MpaB family protein [Arthrobacter sp. NPDC056493]|uniref:oxygenase MpaB family protein n=1 Tax=Arthrobacter sp. NPDC056493 TaxID=3345839 RepID=UPI00366AE42A
MTVIQDTKAADVVVTKERLFGSEQRWRRFGVPTPAGESRRADGAVDYGLFGPGSLAWDIILHPVTIFLETVAQGQVQTTYKPVDAGVRDKDPMTRKGLQGTLTIMDAFDRAQRNSGIHAPMWLADTPSAERIAKHLIAIHGKVVSDIIDVGEPELGGYAANGPRDAMWAALTEMESMLWLYEGLAFRDGKRPHAVSPAQRDAYIAEFGAYVRLFPHADEPPTSQSQLDALHEKYADLFRHSATMHTMVESGEDYQAFLMRNFKKNFHRSQVRVLMPMGVLFGLFGKAVTGCFPDHVHQSMGLTPKQSRAARRARKMALPLVWIFQRSFAQRYWMRLMWGPDGVKLIQHARKLHDAAKRERAASAA